MFYRQDEIKALYQLHEDKHAPVLEELYIVDCLPIYIL